MKYPQKIKKLIKGAYSVTGLSMHEYWEYYEKMLPKAKALVKEKIAGERKGLSGEYNYMHSFRVFEKISELHHWDDPDLELFIAALLHDIVEDGGVSLEDLVDMGFSGRTVELVYLCTHDSSMENHTERWLLMMARLIEARDEEAWCIKLVDLADNLKQAEGLSEENRKFMLEAKVPMMLRLAEWICNGYSHRYLFHLMDTVNSVK